MEFSLDNLFDKKFENGNVDVWGMVDEFFTKHGDKIAPEIINNPALRSIIYSSLNAITNTNLNTKYGKENQTSVVVSPDGKSITLTSNGREDSMFDVRKVPNIRCYQTKIYLDEQGILNYDFSMGTAYDKQRFKDEMKNDNMEVRSETPVMLDTYYEHRMYHESGIELSFSNFGDYYDLSWSPNVLSNRSTYNANMVAEQVFTSLHHPTFHYNTHPEAPRFNSEKAHGTNNFRFLNQLGIIEGNSCDYDYRGNHRNINSGEYVALTEYPERISYMSSITVPKTTNQEEYMQVKHALALRFLEGIKKSETSKDRDKQVTYDALIEHAVIELKKFDSNFTLESEESKSR